MAKPSKMAETQQTQMKMCGIRSRKLKVHNFKGCGTTNTTINNINNQKMYSPDRTISIERNAISHTRVVVFNFCS